MSSVQKISVFSLKFDGTYSNKLGLIKGYPIREPVT